MENYPFCKDSNPFTRDNERCNDTQKRRKECQWSLPPMGWHKANFDGAAKGNLGEAGNGGVIRNSYGYGIAMVTLPLENQTNHFVEACIVIQTTKLAKDIGVRCLWLEGDSNNIIKCLKGEHYSFWSIKNMVEETKQILLTFERVYVSHEYREENLAANWMANEVVKRDMSYRWTNGDSVPTTFKSMIEIERI